MRCYSREPFYILSDGEQLALITDNDAHVLCGPRLKDFSMRFQQEMIDVGIFGRLEKQSFKGPSWTEAEFSVIAQSVITMPASDFDLSRNLIQRYTIYDLFKIINEKIEARKQPPGKGERVTTFG